MKMSKSLGNTINPLDLMRDYGADILRLWALSVDFTEDHRIGKEILGGVADQYRKLRNTFRYLLGALADFREERQVLPAMRRSLSDTCLACWRSSTSSFGKPFRTSISTPMFGQSRSSATRISSAFYFDIRKDVLYCEVNAETDLQTDKRRLIETR